MASHIKSRILIISDTHGDDLIHKPTGVFNVAIHCGDMTEESKLEEFRTSLNMMLAIQAPLKLVIAGNHDFSMDTPVFKNKLADNITAEDASIVKSTYGDFGEARAMFETEATKAAGVVFLDEGNHTSTSLTARLSRSMPRLTRPLSPAPGGFSTAHPTTTFGTSNQAPISLSHTPHPMVF
jgi:predicted phosphodiesterase